jgi:3-phosphoshikimate 1-carboxyvinyltransferase
MFSCEFLDIPALDAASGIVTLPGSKSISNRVLLLAALCDGTTSIHDLLDSDDTRVMLEALETLGCHIRRKGAVVEIDGLGGQLPKRNARLFLGNAGTAMRPLAAALAVLGGDFVLDGVARMQERPIGDLVDALRQLGCRIDYLGQPGFPPLRIGAPALTLDQTIQVRGDVSSQFLTALLMALPLVAQSDITIEVQGELISRPYIDITLNLLERFGVSVARLGWQRFTIAAGSRLRAPGAIHVEADASSASYFVALGAIAAVANGDSPQTVRINGVGADSIQGDIRFIEAAQAMGALIRSGPNWLEVRRGQWPLNPISLDCNHMPDAAMTLAVMALYAAGTSELRNIASWRVKETDRISAMASELRKLGAGVEEGPDFIRVTGPAASADWRAANIRTYDDHRMAMCFSLAAFNPAGLPVRIQDPKCVAKTFPDYFDALFDLATARKGCIPVICIDGPTASGKGTLAASVARQLGYRLLDSGSLYRIAGLVASRAEIPLEISQENAIASLILRTSIEFNGEKILVDGLDCSEAIRTEEAGMNASRVSAFSRVRSALLDLQRNFRRLPGLVADGRDMGTNIFPDARLKIFLTAPAARRAERRHKQLISKGISATLSDLRADLDARDARDASRSIAPLEAAPDARLLDNTNLTVDDSVRIVLDWWQGVQPFESAA